MRVSSRARSGPLCQRGLCFSTRDHDRDNIMLWVLLAVNERQKGQALPLLPNGKQIRVLTRDWSTAGTGGTVWTSAQALCRWLSLSQEAVEGRTILELGSGTGAAGLHAAGLGARSVHLTDGGPPLLLSLLKHNVARNQHKFPVAAAATVSSLRWGTDAAPDCPFDLIIGADVAYHADGRDALCVTLGEVLRRSADGRRARAVLAHEHRAKEGSLEAFADAAARCGMSTRSLHVEEGMVDDPLEARAYAFKVSIVEVMLARDPEAASATRRNQ